MEQKDPKSNKNVTYGNVSFADRFSIILEMRGLTISELSDLLGITRQHVWRIARGKYTPQIDLRMKIAKKLGCDSGMIWTEKREEVEQYVI